VSSNADQTSTATSREVTFTAADLEATIALYKRANRLARLALPPSGGAPAEFRPEALGRPMRLNLRSD
jgi:hypothetical protein